MRVEFVAQTDRNEGFAAANPARLLNCYPEALPAGSIAAYQIRACLGLDDYANLPGVIVRAMAHTAGEVYAVSGGKLSKVEAGAVTELEDVADAEDTAIASNNAEITVTAGGNYYVWDGTNIDQPTPGAFGTFGGHDTLGGYTVITEKDGRRIQWSGLQDAGTLPGLNFATAEGMDDLCIRPMAIAGNMWIFKERSTEIWSLTGDAGANAFGWTGVLLETGLKAFRLACKVPGSVFMVGHDGRVYVAEGSGLASISTRPVEQAIEAGTAISCLYYEDEGHKFGVIRFTDRPAWVFDFTEGLWHERGTETRSWDVHVTAPSGGDWLAAGQGGIVWRMTRNARDGDFPLVRKMVSRTAYMDGNRFIVGMLEFHAKTGHAPGRMLMRVSKDRGETWTLQREREISVMGGQDRRITFRALGQCRSLTVELTVTDAADLTIASAANATL
jgi:hypothetical protein